MTITRGNGGMRNMIKMIMTVALMLQMEHNNLDDDQ